MLHAAGWSVLLISYRNDAGAPSAPEGSHTFGLIEWPDLEAAVARVAPGPDGPGVPVVAESMGGAILGQFLARSDLAPRVAAVALDSRAIRFRAAIEHLAEASGRPLPGPLAWVAGRLLPRMTGLPIGEAEVAEVYARFAGPLFVAHGSGDRTVPIAPSRALSAARQGPDRDLLDRRRPPRLLRGGPRLMPCHIRRLPRRSRASLLSSGVPACSLPRPLR